MITTETSRPKTADLFEKNFPVKYDDGHLIIAYDGKIYCKSGQISDDLLVHEMTHLVQEKKHGKINAFWNKYMVDPEFRLAQELEAYQNQYKFLTKHVKDRNQLYKARVAIAQQLAGEMYGGIIDATEVLKLLKI